MAYHSVPRNMVLYLIMSPYSPVHTAIYSHHEELLLIQVEFRSGCQVNSLGKLGVRRISLKSQGSPTEESTTTTGISSLGHLVSLI